MFNHKKEHVYESLGLTKQRAESLFIDLVTKSGYLKTTEILEWIHNSNLTEREKIFCTYSLGFAKEANIPMQMGEA